MDYETLLNSSRLCEILFNFSCICIFYSYAYSIYKRDKKGETDFEKYSNLVHDDSYESTPLEEREKVI